MQVKPFNSSLPQLNSDTQKRDKTLEKLATAIELKAEDSASRTIANVLQSEISALSQGLMNANDGVAMMQIADGALQSLTLETEKLTDLSVRYNNGSMNESQKQMLQTEFAKTVESMNRVITSTSYNGKALFGNEMTIGMGESSLTASLPNVTPSTISIDNRDGIEAYRERLSQARSDIGSTVNGLISNSNSIINTITNVSTAKSQIADTDMGKAVQDFQQYNLRLDMGQLAAAHHTDVLRQSIGRLLA